MVDRSASGVLCRFGEVFLKRGRKKYFLDVLAGNLERALLRADPTVKLTRPYGRYLAVPKEAGARMEDPDAIAEVMAKVFGIVWAGPVEVVLDATPESLDEAVAAYAAAHRRRSYQTFRISSRRANKAFPLNSIECNRRFGSAAFYGMNEEVQVDLHKPDFEIGVEIREHRAFIYGGGVKGVGGLPVGSNGKALLLLSGGIDSPVAGWLTQKRGVSVDAITFLSPPYTGPQAREKVITLARKLAQNQRSVRLRIVELTRIQETFRDKAPGNQLVLLYRRSMIRMADAVAKRQRHTALVTGENLGQVASQTLPNLHCIGMVATRPIIRPIITYDKIEAIQLAQKIGTFETSILPFDDCCSLFVPSHPELKGRPSILERIEARISPFEMEAEALAAAELLEITV